MYLTPSCIAQISNRLSHHDWSVNPAATAINGHLDEDIVQDSLHTIPVVDDVAARLVYVLRLASGCAVGVDI